MARRARASQGHRRGGGAGDEVVVDRVAPVVIGGRNAGTLTRIPGRAGPHL